MHACTLAVFHCRQYGEIAPAKPGDEHGHFCGGCTYEYVVCDVPGLLKGESARRPLDKKGEMLKSTDKTSQNSQSCLESDELPLCYSANDTSELQICRSN